MDLWTVLRREGEGSRVPLVVLLENVDFIPKYKIKIIKKKDHNQNKNIIFSIIKKTTNLGRGGGAPEK